MSSSSSSSSTSSEPVVTDHHKRKRKRTIERTNSPDTSDGDADSDSEIENAEGPVLSHAEKRRQKKEAKRAEKLKDGDVHPKKKRKLQGGTSQIIDTPTMAAATKRQNSVWVGNLSYKTQHENLREFFKGVGEITRINMPTKARGGPGTKPENRGYAYIDFATPEVKAAAVALSEQPLLGRKLLIKDGDNFEGRPASATLEAVVTDQSIAHKTHSKTAQKILAAQKQPPAPTLFFGNLPFETTEDEIRQLLDAHRPRDKKKDEEGEGDDDKQKEDWIRKIRMGTFEDSGLCKGFAFVDFTSIDNATAALINPQNHHLNGRSLVVEYASPDAVRRGGSKIGGATPRKRRPLSAGYKKTRGRKQKAEGEVQVDDSDKKSTSVAQERGYPPHTGKASKTKKKDKGEKSKSFSTSNKGTVAERGEKDPRSRPKPGAALAQAKRETAAIVPSQGKKIVF